MRTLTNKHICSMDETTINPNNSCRRSHSFTITDPVVGEVVCIDCGTVVSDILMEKRPEWSIHANNELVPRHSASMPTLAIYDQGLSTKIGRDDRDHTGRIIADPSMRLVLGRIRTWDLRTKTRDSKSSSRKEAFDQLDSLRQKLALPLLPEYFGWHRCTSLRENVLFALQAFNR